MSTYQDNTFANTPQIQSPTNSKLHTHKSFNSRPLTPQSPTSYVNIPDLKKQMQDALASKRKVSSKMLNKYPSEVSLMKSDISIISMPSPDIPLNLLQLEMSCTEEILAIREDKITLMEAYNQILEKRYKVEGELNQLKKKTQRKSEIDELLAFDSQSLDKKKIGDSDKDHRKSNSTQSEEDHIIDEIVMVQDISKKIENQLIEKEKSAKQRQSIQTLAQLRVRKSKLLRNLARFSPNARFEEQFVNLIEENAQLLERTHDILTESSTNRLKIQQYLEYIKNDQQAKHQYLKQFPQFKSKSMKLREQNTRLRNQLRNFNKY